MNGLVHRIAVLAFLPALWPAALLAEPYLAVEAGLKCSQCHANPTGGGLRNVLGNTWSQTQIPARRIEIDGAGLWLGRFGEFLAVGGNLRADAVYTRIRGQDTVSEFDITEVRLYLEAQVIPGRLAIYVDERFAPGDATSMEANLRLYSAGGAYYLKAGRMYLPFGWRLEDDNAFVRQLSGINMQVPDEGVELGFEKGPWSGQLALINGSGGSPGNDDGKHLVARVEYVRDNWRIGASGSLNESDAGDRRSAAVFAGLRLGPTHWLAEIDYIDDEGLGTTGRNLLASLTEVNWRVARGHNLKLSHEWFEPDVDVDEDEQTRTSLLYEWSPIQFLQVRTGYRQFDGPRQNDFQNRSEFFLQLHGYF